MKLVSKRTIDKIVNHIELQDLEEFDAVDEYDAEYVRGVARGLRLALELIDKHAVPGYNIIRRGGIGLDLQPYEEDEWTSTKSLQMSESDSSTTTQVTVEI